MIGARGPSTLPHCVCSHDAEIVGKNSVSSKNLESCSSDCFKTFHENPYLPSEHTKRIDVTSLGVERVKQPKLFVMRQFWRTPSLARPLVAHLRLGGCAAEDERRSKSCDTRAPVEVNQDIFLQ